MKRSLIILLLVSLVGGLLSGGSVAAKKKKKKAKPVKTTLYLHGKVPVGEVDGAQWLVDYLVNSANNPNVMDKTKPADPAPKSQNLTNPALNDQCTGLPTGFPTWLAKFSGTIKGTAVAKIHVGALPTTKLTARLWTDLLPFQGCNDAFIPPHAEVTVDVPPGHSEVEVKFPNLKLKGVQYLMLELLGPGRSGFQIEPARVLYDSPDMASSLSFSCIPLKGKSCV